MCIRSLCVTTMLYSFGANWWLFADRLRADSKQFSVDADLPPYDKQFHDTVDDSSEHSGFTSKGSRTRTSRSDFRLAKRLSL